MLEIILRDKIENYTIGNEGEAIKNRPPPQKINNKIKVESTLLRIKTMK